MEKNKKGKKPYGAPGSTTTSSAPKQSFKRGRPAPKSTAKGASKASAKRR